MKIGEIVGELVQVVFLIFNSTSQMESCVKAGIRVSF